ncbi:conserved hypothetical protein [Burkholderia sp. 8Y]|nr:conserved hypothetical protein [Burkholderia sp. 8Y]
MRSLNTRYRGFRLVASARADCDGLHAASVIIRKHGHPARSFNDLDLFHDDFDALQYATTWGRIWIEANVRSPALSQAASDR